MDPDACGSGVLSPISVNPDGSSMVRMLLPESERKPSTFRVLGSEIDVSCDVDLIIYCPSVVVLFGMMMDVRLEQESKASAATANGPRSLAC